ncbi:hypothetical protein JVT61DRAFT_13263 [Boletus reticuloceps]|uniref:Uncharacterized protein n=1 Tax=Boletus reticuloceps TaxID=495285 RepID=A0A8I2YVL3_9AGAM|nr:hypothetical protein JVT61DRAFT_13263 [Boletus reticuloceps]
MSDRSNILLLPSIRTFETSLHFERCNTPGLGLLDSDGSPTDSCLRIGIPSIQIAKRAPSRTTARTRLSALAPTSTSRRYSLTTPVDLPEWFSTSITEINDRDGSLTAASAPPGVAENSDYTEFPSFHPAASDPTLPTPPLSREHSTDARLEPWRSAVAVTSDTHALYAPQTSEIRSAPAPLNRSQVPSGQSQSRRGDVRHAVRASATQQTFLCDAEHPVPAWSYDTPPLPEVGASSGPVHTAVRPWMADPVPWQTPSPSNRHWHRRRPHDRTEHVVCEQCTKFMRRRSLRRHIREVHDHIKRPHPKSSPAT